MFITKKHLSRRTVLKGTGVALSLPLLDAMLPARTALAKTAAKPTMHMGFMYIPMGAVMANWTPKQTGANYEMSPILKPLEPYRKHMTIVSNLRNKAGESPSPHAIIAGTWLACVPPPKSQTPDAGPSCDQMAAKAIGQDTPLPSVELAGEGGGGMCDPNYGCAYSGTVAFRTPTQPLPMEHDPRKAFFRLFGRGDNAQERHAIVHETGSLVDLVMHSAADLRRGLGPADQRRMNDYLDSVREIERRVHKTEAHQGSGFKLPDAPVGVPADFGKMLDLMFGMIKLAWQAKVTRIATFMLAKEVSMRTFPNLGITAAWHPVSHHGGDPVKLAELTKIQTFLTQSFARFIKSLDETPDGDGTLLEHSIILYGSNMSNSDLHNNNPLPNAVLGHGCGTIKGGVHLHFPDNTPHANLLVTLLNRGGVPVKAVGDSTGHLEI